MTAFTERLAANYSLKAQPATPGCAILLNRFLSVLRATWCKATVLTQKRTQNELVSANDGEKYLLHS